MNEIDNRRAQLIPMLTGKRVALYARTSTKHQDLESQKFSLKEEARLLGAVVICEAFDFGVSGFGADRDGVQQLFERKDDFDVILVTYLDRWFRGSPALELLDEMFPMHDVVSIIEGRSRRIGGLTKEASKGERDLKENFARSLGATGLYQLVKFLPDEERAKFHLLYDEKRQLESALT